MQYQKTHTAVSNLRGQIWSQRKSRNEKLCAASKDFLQSLELIETTNLLIWLLSKKEKLNTEINKIKELAEECQIPKLKTPPSKETMYTKVSSHMTLGNNLCLTGSSLPDC
jgi:hypothetical protein